MTPIRRSDRRCSAPLGAVAGAGHPARAIEAEIERLAALPAPANGRRSALIVHPVRDGAGTRSRARDPGRAQRAAARRAHAADPPQLDAGRFLHSRRRPAAVVGGRDRLRAVRRLEYALDGALHDAQRSRRAAGAADLQQRGAAREVERARRRRTIPRSEHRRQQRAAPRIGRASSSSPFGTLPAHRRRRLPDAVRAAHQPAARSSRSRCTGRGSWSRQRLDKLVALGKEYRGRRLYLLFNPATGRTNGTTPQLLRHHHHPPAQHRRPPAPPHLGGDQLLLRRPRPQHGRRPALRVGGRRSDVLGAGLGRAQPRLVRRAGLRADHPGQPAQHRHGVAALAGGSARARWRCWARRRASRPIAPRSDTACRDPYGVRS